MARCLISFGANIGQAADTIRQAAAQLQQRLGSHLRSFHLSRLFRTPAVGGPAGQPPFLNAVAALEVVDRTAWDIWREIVRIEQALGRVRVERWEARRIDLDVLLFDDQRIWTEHFKLPHPRMVMRRFILEPAMDVASEWLEPVSRWTIAELTESLRLGPASIVLVASDQPQAQRMLEHASERSRATWLTPHVNSSSRAEITRDGELSPSVRWLGLLPERALTAHGSTTLHISPTPKMVFVLVEPIRRDGVAWEDYHREHAAWCGMHAQAPSAWPLPGPRYLLATDDPTWAEHEIVAAMEAMDCPVEAMD